MIWYYFIKLRNRQASFGGRGPAEVLEMDGSGVTASFRSQTFKVARYCVRRRLKKSDLQEGDRPALAMLQGRGLGSAGGRYGVDPLLEWGSD